MNRLPTVLLATASALAAVFVGPAAARADTPIAMERNYRSGLCFGPAGASVADNARIVQYFCDAHPTRFWRYVTANDNNEAVQIVNNGTGKCLTPAGASRHARARIVQYACDDDPSRWWTRRWLTDTRYQWVNTQSNLCLSTDGESMRVNSGLLLYDCDDHLSRQWVRYGEDRAEDGVNNGDQGGPGNNGGFGNDGGLGNDGGFNDDGGLNGGDQGGFDNRDSDDRGDHQGGAPVPG